MASCPEWCGIVEARWLADRAREDCSLQSPLKLSAGAQVHAWQRAAMSCVVFPSPLDCSRTQRMPHTWGFWLSHVFLFSPLSFLLFLTCLMTAMWACCNPFAVLPRSHQRLPKWLRNRPVPWLWQEFPIAPLSASAKLSDYNYICPILRAKLFFFLLFFSPSPRKKQVFHECVPLWRNCEGPSGMSGKPTRLVIALMRVIMGFVVLTPTASLQCEGWDMLMAWRNV